MLKGTVLRQPACIASYDRGSYQPVHTGGGKDLRVEVLEVGEEKAYVAILSLPQHDVTRPQCYNMAPPVQGSTSTARTLLNAPLHV